MKGFCPLASGSKGNCIYIGTESTKLLIDVGIATRTVEQRLSEIEVDIQEIDAILVSHEHSDHIRGIERLATKYNLPVFANSETAKAILSSAASPLKFKIFSTGESFIFGDIEIHPFSIQHDTLDPVAFTFRMGEIKVGVCTDLGLVTTLVKSHLRECAYLYVEANHEPSMVYACSRPPVYKQRVLGRQGHLSNESCAALIDEVYHEGLKHIYLAHLSEECNNPEKALKRVREQLGERHVPISIAYQEKKSDLIRFT